MQRNHRTRVSARLSTEHAVSIADALGSYKKKNSMAVINDLQETYRAGWELPARFVGRWVGSGDSREPPPN